MNKRLVAWALLVMFGQGVAGCGGSDSSSTPLAPTPSTTQLAPSPQPTPQRPLVDLTGKYLLTFEAGNPCEQLPKEFRSRTYEASIGYAGPAQSGNGDWFRADLSGAHFHEWAHVVVISVAGNSVRFDLSDNIIVEKPAPDTYLMIGGSDGVASVEATDLSTISASFEGFFEYCVTTSVVRAGSHCPTDATVRSVCNSKGSRWTLTRQ